jgi:hypothetical protein
LLFLAPNKVIFVSIGEALEEDEFDEEEEEEGSDGEEGKQLLSYIFY